MYDNLQILIGTDKKNPIFSLFENPLTNTLHVFLGGIPFDVVENNKNNPEFKLMLARLFNAKVNQKALLKTFGIALTTIRRWAIALKCGDGETLVGALSGAGPPKKLTTEIKSFVKVRFRSIYKNNHYNYSSIIRGEIKEIFGVELCSETIRSIFNEVKNELSIPDSKNSSRTFQFPQNSASSCDSEIENQVEKTRVVSNNGHLKDLSKDYKPRSDEDDSANRKNSLCSASAVIPKIEGYAHHAGVLIFTPILEQIRRIIPIEKEFISQWIVLTLLGIQNIEQSKKIDFDSLEVMFGKMTSTFQLQRDKLSKLSRTPCIIDYLVHANGELVSVRSETDFYYDPHTKHYTGIEKILKGWCGALGKTGKAIHMDFIHTSAGNPVYIEHCDNFDDLRERFLPILNRFRERCQMPETAVLSIAIDRGIFSMEIFNKFIGEANYHLITWEKGYKRDKWDESLAIKTFSFFRSRNFENNFFKYSFSFIERKWEKNKKIRQFIVRATNYKNRTIEISIVTDDLTRDGEEIIKIMFTRWLQENDFKYLIKHFGINELISRISIPYKELKQKVNDKKVLSGEHIAYKKESKKIKKEMEKLLFKNQTQKLTSKKKKENKQKLEELTAKHVELKLKTKETKNGVSKLEKLINENYCRLQTDKKLIMDYIKVIARNIFYTGLQPFKKSYNNYRDDHVLFRSISRCDGYISNIDNEIVVTLNPSNRYMPRVHKLFQEYLDNINFQKMKFPDNYNRNLKIILTDKQSKLFAIPN